jgi:hypothetical protein
MLRFRLQAKLLKKQQNKQRKMHLLEYFSRKTCSARSCLDLNTNLAFLFIRYVFTVVVTNYDRLRYSKKKRILRFVFFLNIL